MRRREFLALLGSAIAGNPLAVHAQQPAPVRRVAVLMGAAETPSSRAERCPASARRTRTERASQPVYAGAMVERWTRANAGVGG